uniref:N-acetyltransferase domain-containing protein n=1 Tax=Coptotermes formosanus TaxID=36987 RepID=R4UL84_COPFO|nr:hypothetical protein [Coptotermes formosanus]
MWFSTVSGSEAIEQHVLAILSEPLPLAASSIGPIITEYPEMGSNLLPVDCDSFSLRQYEPALHRRKVAVLLEDCWFSLTGPSITEGDLDAGISFGLVAVNPGGEVLGFVGGRVVDRAWYCAELVVRAQARRCRLGRRLLNSFLAFRPRLCDRTTLCVRMDKLAAQSLYESVGFEVTDVALAADEDGCDIWQMELKAAVDPGLLENGSLVV